MNLRYYRFNESNFEDVYELESDPEVMKYTGPGRALSLEEIKVRFSKLIGPTEHKLCGYWAVYEKDVFIAWLMLLENFERDEIEIGFMVKKSFWARGYASQIIRDSLKKINESNYKGVLIATVDRSNIASCRAFRSFEFEENIKESLILFEKNFFCSKSF